MDMVRIRAATQGDETVERLFAVVCAEMAKETENHASEWLAPEGKLRVEDHAGPARQVRCAGLDEHLRGTPPRDWAPRGCERG